MRSLPRLKRGKSQGRPASVNAATGPKGSLLHVTDNLEGHKWLVDGGALLSIVPPTKSQRRLGPNGTGLCAANGTKINCYGSVEKTLNIGSRTFTFSFTIADVRQRILGADFLAAFYLAPNHRDGTLIDLDNFDVLPATFAHGATSNPVTLINEVNDQYYKLLDAFPEILTPSFTPVEVKHGVRHHIPTNGHPVQNRARKLDSEKLRVAKAEIDKLVKLGVCQRASAADSEWASPLMVAKKPCVVPCKCTPTTPCGGWRVCGDYRRLNAVTQDDKYPVRSIHDFNAELHGKKIFSKIDLMKGYHQIPVAEEDVGKTGIITPFGLFVFPRTPFGLKNAGQDFQRLMDTILGDIPRVYVYIDDILVASETPEQHLADLEAVFKTLSENGLVVQRSKCILGKSSLEFLGYHVDATGVRPLPHRVESIRSVPAPTTLKELQRFLGMVNYYRRFIRRAAYHLHPLFNALKGPKKEKGEKKVPRPKTLAWNEDLQKSFEAIKEALAVATLLHHPRPNAPLALTTDASKYAIGGVLEQLGPNGWEPLSFYSSKLEDHQTGDKWPAYDRELLAMFRAVRHFRPMIEGHAFTIFTDQEALVPSMKKKSEPLTARQNYQLSCVSEYTTDIRYIEGKSNVVADALSRPPGCDKPTVSTVSSTPAVDNPKPVPPEKVDDLTSVVNAIGPLNVDLSEMAREQPLDPDFVRISAESRTGLNFKKINLGETQIIVDISNGPARPFVPYAWRRRIFNAVHGLGHPGVDRTRQMVCSKFVWPSIRQDVTKWARECLDCQRSKVNRHTVAPIAEFAVPSKRFQHWNVDIVSLPTSNGFKYLLTAVDRLTRWPLAIPMKDITAASVIDAFTHGLISTFGVPESVTTDNGSQFTSSIWRQLLDTWGIRAHFTTPYHPQSNGLVERFHRRLKESLNALGSEEPDHWFWKLPCTLLAIRTTLKPDIGASPADLVFGEGLAVPGELLSSAPTDDSTEQNQRRNLLDNLRLEVARVQPKPTSAHRRPNVHIPQDLRNSSHVFVQRGGVQPSLSTPYVGPYRVTNREQSSFRIAIPGSQSENVNIARLKPAILPDDEDSQEPPDSPTPRPPPGRRPRPPLNPPPASDRETRQSSSRRNNENQNPLQPDPLAFDPGEGTSAQARAQSDPALSDEEDEYLHRLRRLRNWGPSDNNNSNDITPPPSPPPVAIPAPSPPPDQHVPDPFDGHVPPSKKLAACPCEPPAGPCVAPPPRRFTAPRERTFSNRGGPIPEFQSNDDQTPQVPQSPNTNRQARPPRQFSNPKPHNFSYRRRRPDVNAFFNILSDHLSL